MNTARIAIITVTLKHAALEDFFASLQKQTDKDFHLFITDLSNDENSLDKTLPYTLIRAENKGYAFAVNRGIKEAQKRGFRHFCIVNDDIYFDPDFIKNLRGSFSDHPRSVIGGKIYYAPHYEYHKERYREKDLGKVFWYAGGFISWEHALAVHRGVDEVDIGQYDKFEQADFITGCLIAFDEEVLKKVGFWDEKYFLYFEDADFCERAKKKGVKLYYNPELVIWHKVSQSTGGSGSALHRKYQLRNAVIFGLKYAPIKTKIHLVKNYLFNLLKRR